MEFESILFETPQDRAGADEASMPDFFVDLNLDQIVEAVVRTRQEYDLKPLFWTPLKRLDAIKYRHEIMRELENEHTAAVVAAFSRGMRSMRECLERVDKLYFDLQKQRWFLDAAGAYCEAVTSLQAGLSGIDLKSRGLLAFRKYLDSYIGSESFKTLAEDARQLKEDLTGLDYCIRIKGKTITVRRCESEMDFSADVERVFERFKQGAARDYRTKFPERLEMNQVEAQILEAVARLYPDIFEDLDVFCEKYADFQDATVVAFDREVQFYLAYLEFMASIKAGGLQFCYPEVSDTDKEISVFNGYDLALANKNVTEKLPVVCNDFFLTGRERIFVVSGPNQGGKTTFARSFGQIHYLASLGCPVPGETAKVFLFDQMFTHFEKGENVEDLRSKLEDDLIRIHDILTRATPSSIIIVNEILTSTTLKDAIFLGRKVMEDLTRLDALCVWVTFVEELASYSDKTVSMISMVAPDNPAIRTYKVVRKPAYGPSYAAAIAEKYGLTYGALKERIKP